MPDRFGKTPEAVKRSRAGAGSVRGPQAVLCAAGNTAQEKRLRGQMAQKEVCSCECKKDMRVRGAGFAAWKDRKGGI